MRHPPATTRARRLFQPYLKLLKSLAIIAKRLLTHYQHLMVLQDTCHCDEGGSPHGFCIPSVIRLSTLTLGQETKGCNLARWLHIQGSCDTWPSMCSSSTAILLLWFSIAVFLTHAPGQVCREYCRKCCECPKLWQKLGMFSKHWNICSGAVWLQTDLGGAGRVAEGGGSTSRQVRWERVESWVWWGCSMPAKSRDREERRGSMDRTCTQVSMLGGPCSSNLSSPLLACSPSQPLASKEQGSTCWYSGQRHRG